MFSNESNKLGLNGNRHATSGTSGISRCAWLFPCSGSSRTLGALTRLAKQNKSPGSPDDPNKTRHSRIVFMSSFLFLSLLFIFTLADLFTRRLDSEMHITKSPVDKEWVHPNTLPNGGH